jgi:hypothetical protein
MLSIREVKYGTRKIITGTIEEFNSYLKASTKTEDEVLHEMMKAFPGSTFEIAKRVTKGTTIVYVKDELEKIAQKEAELKIKEAERKEAHRIARTRAFFNSLLWQDNVKVSLGKVTLINDIRLFQVVYDLASTRYSFVDLMKLKEDTGLTVKFEVIRVKNETETVETNHGTAYDGYEFSDTVISSVDSEIIIETYYY